MRILIAAITNGRSTSTLGFCVNLVRLQNELARNPDLSGDVCFFDTLNDALLHFRASNELDCVVAIDVDKAAAPEFVIKAAKDTSKPFVVGIYPLPGINWDAVSRKLALKVSEDVSSMGNTYSVDDDAAAKATPVDGGYLQVPHSKLGVVKIGRQVLDALESKFAPELLGGEGAAAAATTPIFLADVPGKDKARRFCDMWTHTGGLIYADTDWPCSSSGPVAFSGCVGNRRTLR